MLELLPARGSVPEPSPLSKYELERMARIEANRKRMGECRAGWRVVLGWDCGDHLRSGGSDHRRLLCEQIEPQRSDGNPATDPVWLDPRL